LDEQLLGVTRLAVVVADDHGRVTHWSRGAVELFGVDTPKAVGRPLRSLLRLPQEHREVFEPSRGRIVHPWTGICLVPRVDDGELQEIVWWAYPLRGPGPTAMVAIAADARRLRDEGPGLALGDQLLVPPSNVPLTGAGGLRVLRIEPAFLSVSEVDGRDLRRRLTEMMPLMGPDNSEEIVGQILSSGYPAVNVSVTVRLPFAAYWGTVPGVARLPARTVAEIEVTTVPASRPQSADDGGALEATAFRERLTLLSETGARIAETLDPVQTATELCEMLMPRFADFAGVHLIERIVTDQELPIGEPDEYTKAFRAAVSHNDEQGRWDDVVPVGETLRLPAKTPFMKSMKTGRSMNIGRVTAEMGAQISAAFGDRDLRPLIQGRALMVAPLIARGAVFGNIILMRKPDRPPFDELDIATAEELCRRAAVCIDNGRLYLREARAAAKLQRSMLPDAPPVVAGAQICYRYIPADEAEHVGGDWFDAIQLSGSRVAFVVGDVMGHGLSSAAIMGQLRTAIRTLAVQDLPPAQLLRQLDDLAQRLGADYLATCLYVVYDPVARHCEVACAGHLPPVLISPTGAGALLDLPAGAPIGVGGVAFETVGFDAEDGSRLVLFTDGLVERRGRDLDAGLVALRDHLTGPLRPLEAVCEDLIEEVKTADPDDRPDDDVAVLAVRFEGIPKQDVAAWSLEAEPSMVRRAREVSRAALESWGLSELADTVELMISELVTNALMHGDGQIGLRLIRADALLCEVQDDGNELPYLCHAESTDENGRGLQLVTHLADRWGAHRTATGKVVWFEIARPDGVPSPS
jgi:serine phosphatase RsbU (regulator of sigma subunit)/anti-sigma regulatory factor (Ser/Thr protein kinase)